MLLLFEFSNFLSFKDESSLNMTAMDCYRDHPYTLMPLNAKENVLRVAAVYGANASGKSNLCFAFETFRSIVLESANIYTNVASSTIQQNYTPFSLKRDGGDTSFRMVAKVGENEYTYGFEYNGERIVREWLYARNDTTHRQRTILERYSNGEMEFHRSVPSRWKSMATAIPDHVLALTFFNTLKEVHGPLREMFSFIQKTQVMGTDFYEAKSLLEKRLPEEIRQDKRGLLEFLEAMDTGIIDLRLDQMGGADICYTIHRGPEGEDFTLPLHRESDGTLKSMALYLFAKKAVREGNTMFIDELNVKLHPLMLKFIIDLFYAPSSTAQLIYTSHDTSLLDKRFFRRDQIWFVEKNQSGESQLVALSDYKMLPEEALQSNYLAGVYGGIPALKDFSLKVRK
ncbi:MAG: ATP-binding protein [Tissierellia bacterium]|nr:ATP-binding protein [Tissierellia bacterium]